MRLAPIILSTGLALSSYSPAHAVVTVSAANAAAAAANSANNASKRRNNENPGTEQQYPSKTPDFCTALMVENMKLTTGNHQRWWCRLDADTSNCMKGVAKKVQEVLAMYPTCHYLVPDLVPKK